MKKNDASEVCLVAFEARSSSQSAHRSRLHSMTIVSILGQIKLRHQALTE